jgi:large subunit ribosomal protein L25
LVRDVAVHPVTDKVEHVDFLRVGPKTKIKVFVPVHFKNEAACPGVKNKGVLNVVSHEVELLCIAQDIPDAVEVDLKDLNIAQSIKLSEVQLPAGAESAHKNRDVTIATVVAPTDYSENEITAPVSDEANAAAKAAAAPAKGAAKPAAKK